jgi:hypothetical protein
MNQPTIRIIDPEQPPSLALLESWMGKKACGFWTDVSNWIAQSYPGVFSPEWLFGGKKHGWSLRYKKSKSFCTFVPEKNQFAIVIVFGADEREKVEKIRAELSPMTLDAYDQATTYHDGKWLYLIVNSKGVIRDVQRLLAVKRKSKIEK